MNTSETRTRLFEELDYRENDGVQVSLIWNRADNGVSVLVTDTRGGESFDLPVTGADALDAFNHPYAYAAFRRLDLSRSPAAEQDQRSSRIMSPLPSSGSKSS